MLKTPEEMSVHVYNINFENVFEIILFSFMPKSNASRYIYSGLKWVLMSYNSFSLLPFLLL